MGSAGGGGAWGQECVCVCVCQGCKRQPAGVGGAPARVCRASSNKRAHATAWLAGGAHQTEALRGTCRQAGRQAGRQRLQVSGSSGESAAQVPVPPAAGAGTTPQPQHKMWMMQRRPGWQDAEAGHPEPGDSHAGCPPTPGPAAQHELPNKLIDLRASSLTQGTTAGGSRDVEPVHGVAPDGVHLSRHDVQVDVLQHAHNVCAGGVGGRGGRQGMRAGERVAGSRLRLGWMRARAGPRAGGGAGRRRAGRQQPGMYAAQPIHPASQPASQPASGCHPPVSRPGLSSVLTSSTEWVPVGCSRTSIWVEMPRLAPSGAVGSMSRVTTAAGRHGAGKRVGRARERQEAGQQAGRAGGWLERGRRAGWLAGWQAGRARAQRPLSAPLPLPPPVLPLQLDRTERDREGAPWRAAGVPQASCSPDSGWNCSRFCRMVSRISSSLALLTTCGTVVRTQGGRRYRF